MLDEISDPSTFLVRPVMAHNAADPADEANVSGCTDGVNDRGVSAGTGRAVSAIETVSFAILAKNVSIVFVA